MTSKTTNERQPRVLLIVEEDSVLSKPDYVDLVEIVAHSRQPVVVHP